MKSEGSGKFEGSTKFENRVFHFGQYSGSSKLLKGRRRRPNMQITEKEVENSRITAKNPLELRVVDPMQPCDALMQREFTPAQ